MAVKTALEESGLETPLVESSLNRDQKYQKIKDSFNDITLALGLDLLDDSLRETPHRVAKMFVDEIFSGLDYQNFPKITLIENKMNIEEMVHRRYRTCQHMRTSS